MREQLKSKWIVINGGSNAILTAIAVGNVMEPEGTLAIQRALILMPLKTLDPNRDGAGRYTCNAKGIYAT